jgi:hypothetical protein
VYTAHACEGPTAEGPAAEGPAAEGPMPEDPFPLMEDEDTIGKEARQYDYAYGSMITAIPMTILVIAIPMIMLMEVMPTTILMEVMHTMPRLQMFQRLLSISYPGEVVAEGGGRRHFVNRRGSCRCINECRSRDYTPEVCYRGGRGSCQVRPYDCPGKQVRTYNYWWGSEHYLCC